MSLQPLVGDYLAGCRARGLSPTSLEACGYPLEHVLLPWCFQQGITDPVVLFRGMRHSIGADSAPVDAATEPVPAKAHLNPLNSWTANYDVSQAFSGYVLTARVPASKVVGCCFTGLGCLNEQEFIVVGGAGQQVMAAAEKQVSYSHLSGRTWKS